MAGSRTNTGNSSASTDRHFFGRIKAPSGRPVWVSLEPTPDVFEELIRHFPEIVELPEEEIKTETDDWSAKRIMARPLDRKHLAEAVVREFRLQESLKGDVEGFNLQNGFLLFRFKELDDRDKVLHWSWIVNDHVLALEPWQPCFLLAEMAIQTAMV